MSFLRFFPLILLVTLVSCGQKSKVDSLAEPVKLKDVYYITLPLSESSLDPIETPLPDKIVPIPYVDDVLRAFARFAYNTAARFGMGKQKIVVKQAIPDISSPYIKSLSVKRVFFHIDLKPGAKPKKRSWFERALNKLSWGKWFNDKDVSFDFIRELKVRLKMHRDEGMQAENEDFIPEVEIDDNVNPGDFNDTSRVTTDFDLLSYKRSTRSQVLLNSQRGPMLMVYSDDPPATRNFFKKNKAMRALINEPVQINKTFMVEIKGKELEVEKFNQVLERYEDEADLSGITRIDTCTDMTCMDIKVKSDNVYPLLLTGNKLHIETIMDASKVPPESFQLKGFVVFEVRIIPPF